jgi:hypothetical protein
MDDLEARVRKLEEWLPAAERDNPERGPDVFRVFLVGFVAGVIWAMIVRRME